jgi:hypothetical protein
VNERLNCPCKQCLIMGPEEAARKAKFDQLMMEKEPEIKALEKRWIVVFKNLS